MLKVALQCHLDYMHSQNIFKGNTIAVYDGNIDCVKSYTISTVTLNNSILNSFNSRY